MVSDFTLKESCMEKNHEKQHFCPKFPLTRLKMLLMGRNCPKLVDIMHVTSQFNHHPVTLKISVSKLVMLLLMKLSTDKDRRKIDVRFSDF